MSSKFTDYDWERGTMLQLYKEYKNILWQQRVKLRPVAIHLFDSQKNWGEWNPRTRTIQIAKALVKNHSWFYVQAILRHEMAHQYVDEVLTDGSFSHPPHGELFQKACQNLGVLQQFRKSAVSIQDTQLNCKDMGNDSVTEKLLDRVQKLLALATSSNQNEALLAMDKVRELYAKHNLEGANQPRQERYTHLVIHHKKKRVESHESRIISILIEHFFVEVLKFALFDAETGESYRAFEIIGLRENVLMAEYVYYFLLQQSEFWVRGVKLSRIQRKSFRLGLLEGFSEKLKNSETLQSPNVENHLSRNSSSTELSLVGKALVSFRKDKQITSYLQEVYPRVTRSSSSRQRVDNSAYFAGIEVGRKITLHKALTSSSQNLGKLIE